MSRRDLALLAFKLLGVWFVLYALQSMIPFFLPLEGMLSTLAMFLPNGLLILSCGVFLWCYAKPLSARIFPEIEESAEASTPTDWFRAAWITIGVWLVVTGITQLGYYATLMAVALVNNEPMNLVPSGWDDVDQATGSYVSREMKASMFSDVVSVVLGGLMVLRKPSEWGLSVAKDPNPSGDAKASDLA